MPGISERLQYPCASFGFKHDVSPRKRTVNSPCPQSQCSSKRCAPAPGLTATRTSGPALVERAKSTLNRASEGKKTKPVRLQGPRGAYEYMNPGCLDTTAAGWHATTDGNSIKAT